MEIDLSDAVGDAMRDAPEYMTEAKNLTILYLYVYPCVRVCKGMKGQYVYQIPIGLNPIC